MNRRVRLVLYCIAAVLAALAPLIGLLAVSYWQTTQRVQAELNLLARATAERASAIFHITSRNLHDLATETQGQCSPPGIRAMNDAVFRTIYIREVGIISDTFLLCTDLGLNDPPTRIDDARYQRLGRPGQITIIEPLPAFRGGNSVFVNYALSSTAPLTHLRYINALIAPETFWEFHDFLGIGDDSGVFLVLEDGSTVLSFGRMGEEVLPLSLSELPHIQHHGNNYLAVYRSDPFPVFAVVAASDSFMLRQWRQTALWFSVLGLVASVALVTLVVRLGLRSFSLEADFRQALASNQLEMRYQPIIDLTTGRCVGAEALLRWPHAVRGFIPPAVFIPLAEHTGMLIPMTRFVLTRVASEVGALLQQRPDLRIFVNLSAEDLKSEGLLRDSARAFADKLNPRQVTYEITEHNFVSHIEAPALTVLSALRQRGSCIALDDFGTGYSSLGYLQRFSVDYLKIDKAFVDSIQSETHSTGLLDYVINLAASLKVHMIAEGVEHAYQAQYLAAQGVQWGQGWHFAKPMPIAAFVAFCSGAQLDTELGAE